MKIVFLLSCILASIVAMGQNSGCKIVLRGQVLDEHDQSPLSWSNIWIEELARGTISDSAGRFVFDHLCAGSYTVVCSHIGCEDVLMKVELRADTFLLFEPEHHIYELGLFQIEEERREISALRLETNLDSTTLERNRGEDISRLAAHLPGMSTAVSGATVGKPVLHGMQGMRLPLFDGSTRLEGQAWGADHAPEIDPLSVGSIKIIRGAGSVRYASDAIGGILIVEPPKFSDSTSINGWIFTQGNSNGKGVTAAGQVAARLPILPKLAFSLNGSYRLSGNYHSPDYYLENTATEGFDFGGRLRYDFKNVTTTFRYKIFNGRYGVYERAAQHSLSDFLEAIQSEPETGSGTFSYEIGRPWQRAVHETVEWMVIVNKGFLKGLSSRYSRQYNERLEHDKHIPRSDSLAGLELPDLNFRLTSHAIELLHTHRLSESFRAEGGVTGSYQGNTYSGRFMIPNFRNYGIGAFYTGRYGKGPYHLEGGIRYDRRRMEVFIYQGGKLEEPIHDFGGWTVTTGMGYKSEEVDLRAVFGSSWRAPAINELYSNGIHHGTASFERGNATLEPERSLNFTLPLNWKPLKQIETEFVPYIHYIRGFIFPAPQPDPMVTIRGTFPLFEFEQSDATIAGADLMVRSDWKKYQAELMAALVYGRDRLDASYLYNMPPPSATLGLERKFFAASGRQAGWIRLRGNYVSRQIFEPPADYLPPPDGYFLLGSQAGINIHLRSGNVFMLMFSAENLTNTRHSIYLDRFRYFADARGMDFRLSLRYLFQKKLNSKN